MDSGAYLSQMDSGRSVKVSDLVYCLYTDLGEKHFKYTWCCKSIQNIPKQLSIKCMLNKKRRDIRDTFAAFEFVKEWVEWTTRRWDSLQAVRPGNIPC